MCVCVLGWVCVRVRNYTCILAAHSKQIHFHSYLYGKVRKITIERGVRPVLGGSPVIMWLKRSRPVGPVLILNWINL